LRVAGGIYGSRFPVITVAIVILVIYLLSSIKILAEYERASSSGWTPARHAKGPGIILVFSPIDRMVRISLRQEALEVPPQTSSPATTSR